MEYQETQSIWQKEELPYFPHLGANETVDVCVIGSGIAGLTTAYKLLRQGKSVVVLERNGFRHGQTILTSAHICSALDDRYFEIKRLHGENGAGKAAESHSWAIDEIERIVGTESIDCEFERVNGYLFLGENDKESILEKELRACHEAGLSGVKYLSSAKSPLLAVGPSLRFPNQARFHPGKYLDGLANAVRRRGGKIYVHTEAGEIEGGNPARVNTNRGFHITAEAVVVATNVPFNDRLTMHTKMAPYRTYVLGLTLPESRADTSLFWDTGDPYHYVRTCTDVDGAEILLVGGEDHRTGQEIEGVDRYQRLEQWALNRLGVEGSVRYHWSGQILEPHDGLAYIGRNPGDKDNIFIVTGDSGNGLTHGTIAGKLLTDLILGKDNSWASLYEPSRINIRSLPTFVKENARGAAPYVDWVSGGDVASIDDIPRGDGAILRDGMQKIAAYKDVSGQVHFYSAVCPHLSGIVRWNGEEKTWDCPCHGSRFSRTGEVINGPASTGLIEIVDLKERELA